MTEYKPELNELLTKEQLKSLTKNYSDENIILAYREVVREIGGDVKGRKTLVFTYTRKKLRFNLKFKQRYCPHCKKECEALLSEAEIDFFWKEFKKAI